MGTETKTIYKWNTTIDKLQGKQLIMITPKTKGMTLTGETVPICKKRKRYGTRKAKARFRASRVRA